MTREELYQGVIGTELKADTTREGVIDDGNVAWPERVFEARRQWTQARPEDFVQVGKRLWRDKATGIEFRQAHGAPLLSIGSDAVRNISAFFILDGRLIFLERADLQDGLFVHTGQFYGGEIVGGKIVKETT